MIQTADELLHDYYYSRKLSTGCSDIDACLDGGIPLQGISELSGESSAGKTQIGLQLLLQCHLPLEEGGLSGNSVFLSTEGDFSIERLSEMGDYFSKKHPEYDLNSLFESIFIEKVATNQEMLNRLPLLLENSNIKLIVIDSITAMFRGEFDNTLQDMKSRTEWLITISIILHQLNYKYKIPIVVINQITDVFDGSSNTSSSLIRNVTPALGNVWSYYINHRFMISRYGSTIPNGLTSKPEKELSDDVDKSKMRRFDVVFSPILKSSCCYFTVDPSGVVNV